MTIIETPTREQVMAEHDEILARLRDRYNTTDTSELRDISVSGEMSGRTPPPWSASSALTTCLRDGESSRRTRGGSRQVR
jgi:hypothetical protein